MGTSMRRLWDLVAGRPEHQMMGSSGDVHRTSVVDVF